MTSMLYNSFGLARRSEKQFPLLSGQSSLKGVLERDNAMNFIWLCACGCGKPSPIAKRTRSARGQVKGQFLRFISGHNAALFDSKEQQRRSFFRNPDSLRYSGSRNNYIKYKGRHLHRIVAESMLNRPLAEGEIVHHKDGDKWNNSPENLEVMTQSAHIKIHIHAKRSTGQ